MNEVLSQTKRPLLGGNLRPLLGLVLLLFALLTVNSLYLGTTTLREWFTGQQHQDAFYLLMFLLHLILGLLLIPPFLLFGLLHQQRARRRPNRYAIRAGMGLFTCGLLLIVSGLILTRFGFFEVNDPAIRVPSYWVHVLTPLAAAWLFVIHRLAGPPIRWRVGGYWASAALLLTALVWGLRWQDQEQAPATAELTHEPALVRVQGPRPIPAKHLMQDEECAECHRDIVDQAKLGIHRFSSFNNPAYRFSIDEARQTLLKRDGEVKVARLCAVCHDQVPLFAGRFDDPAYQPDGDPGAQAGIGCLGCHAITAINSPKGNGAYDFQDPPGYPFAHSDSPLLKAINRQLIKAKPAFHKATLLKPMHKTAEFCSACHKVHLPYALNHYKWLRGQNHYDSFLLSGVSGHRVDSFYYPDKAIANCAQCHMPPVASDDPAARDFLGKDGQASVHDHRFAAANTGVPHLLGHRVNANGERLEFLKRAARLDLFGIKEDGDIDGRLHAPLRPQLPVLEPGRRYLLELVVRTLGVGHQLTQGTIDSNELWLDLVVKSGDRVIGRGGGQNAQGDVDPWAYFVNGYILDREGNHIDRRNAHDVFVALYDHQIPPGAATTVHYALQVPSDVAGPIQIEARLRYRKFDGSFLRHVLGKDYERNNLPIATLAEDQLTLEIAGGPAPTAQSSPTATWERWNDYGIGLLRKGKRELRQAEQAFQQVEALRPDHGALNLARVQLAEGRIEDAAQSLRRAAAAKAPPWTLAWFSALVDRELGHLDRAIDGLRGLLDTRFQAARERGFDFSRDYRARSELAAMLFERARQERGEPRLAQRRQYLEQARDEFNQVLREDPENVTAHYGLAQLYAELGDGDRAAGHRRLHQQYRTDDQAVEQAVRIHRAANPAADHAAEETAIYDLQRPGTYDLEQRRIIASTRSSGDTP